MERKIQNCAVHSVRNKLIDLWYRADAQGEEKKILARCAGILTGICYGFAPGKASFFEKAKFNSQKTCDDVKELETDSHSSSCPAVSQSEQNEQNEQNQTGLMAIRDMGLLLDILNQNGSDLCMEAFSLIEYLLSDNRKLLMLHVKDKQCQAGICFKQPSPPCQKACPAGIDIPGFMTETGKGNYSRAVEIITEVNPFPYVCGMICPAPCENACLRQYFDEPVFIRTMKAVAAKQTIKKQGRYPKPAKKAISGKRIAIVGAGPAGLTAAFFLAKSGHAPVVFESAEKPGGMLRYGIPDFRLPPDILENDISWIESNGVKIKTGRKIQGVSDLFNRGFHAVFLSPGIPVSKKIPFKGNDFPHVISGVDFLRKVNKNENPSTGSEVVVIGGGNVAVDVAMAALRQGAHKVHMVCLENADEMPASRHELKTATDEGIMVHNSWGPFQTTEDKIFEAVFCKRVFDDNGRFAPEFDNTKKLTLHSDNILIAAGQAADLSFLGDDNKVKTDRGLISVRENSYETDWEGVFAGGDVVSGPGIAVEAIKSGKQAAEKINAWLAKKFQETGNQKSANDQKNAQHANPRDASDQPEPDSAISQSGNPGGTDDDDSGNLISHMPLPLKVDVSFRQGRKRAVLEEKSPDKRKNNYLPVEFELDPGLASMEAERCLRCDLCIGCGLCQFICSEMGVNAIRLAKTDDNRFVFVDFTTMADKCISCGACAEVCPTGAIKVVQHDLVRQTEFTGTNMCEHSVLKCQRCNKPLMPERYYNFLEKKISKHQAYDKNSLRLCQACTMVEIAAKADRYNGSFIRNKT